MSSLTMNYKLFSLFCKCSINKIFNKSIKKFVTIYFEIKIYIFKILILRKHQKTSYLKLNKFLIFNNIKK